MRTCSNDGCERRHLARGLCSTHYNQAYQPNRHRGYRITCEHCGVEHVSARADGRFCSLTCRDAMRHDATFDQTHSVLPDGHPVRTLIRRNTLSPLRLALEDEDWSAVMAVIRSRCDERPSGCWEWQGRLSKDCYPVVVVANKTIAVHRLMLEAKHDGRKLGRQAAHHVCANSFCVNPSHLQPVTAAQNTAEMLARTYMTSYITDLQAALAEYAPTHPLLAVIGPPPRVGDVP